MSRPYKIISTIKSTETAIFSATGELVDEWANDDGTVYDDHREELTEEEMQDYFPEEEEND